MKSRTATATAVAAGLSCAAEVVGTGFFGPLAGSAAHGVAGRRGSREVSTPDASSRWLGGAGRRGARKGVAGRLYELRGGASGASSVVAVTDSYWFQVHKQVSELRTSRQD